MQWSNCETRIITRRFSSRSRSAQFHAEALRDRRKLRPEPFGIGFRVARRLPSADENNAHEEAAALQVVELLGLQDIAAGLEQEGRDGSDDTGAVRRRDGQDILRLKTGVAGPWGLFQDGSGRGGGAKDASSCPASGRMVATWDLAICVRGYSRGSPSAMPAACTKAIGSIMCRCRNFA